METTITRSEWRKEYLDRAVIAAHDLAMMRKNTSIEIEITDVERIDDDFDYVENSENHSLWQKKFSNGSTITIRRLL